MTECLGECGKEQQTMKQVQAGLYSEDPGWVPGGLIGNLGWPLLERGVGSTGQRGPDLWSPSPATHCFGLSGPALPRASCPGHVWEKGILRDLESGWHVSSLSLSE